MVKLLLIEDEKILRENTAELLEIHGFECITAQHGREGLEKALSERPDLIICDIMLPLLNGFQIKEELNRLNNVALIPFIFLSAKADRGDLRQGMDLGAADYITKPFKIKELVNSIRSRLTQSKSIQTEVHEKVIGALNDFIQLSKHEYNTPLHGIITLSEILTTRHASHPEFFDKALKSINTSGKRLHKTLNNLIDLIHLKNDPELTDTVPELPNIKILLKRILSERSNHYKYAGELKINIDCRDTICLLKEDLEIVIFEVIDNMFKFCSSGFADIELTTKADEAGRWMVLKVSNGISVPVLFRKSDIGPFKQYNRSEFEQQGSGLGLYLTQMIMEKYQGHLEIDTEDLNMFSITISFSDTSSHSL